MNAAKRNPNNPTIGEDVVPHSLNNPPAATTQITRQEIGVKFVIARPPRPGQVVASMAKRPIKKD